MRLHFLLSARRWIALWAAGAALCAAAQQADPPTRVARIDVAEGSVQYQLAAEGQPRPADARWPLTTGDTVWTDPGARAELHAGSATLRLDSASTLGFTVLDDRTTQVRLTAGTVGVQVRSLEAGERFEVDTPNLALVLDRPGRWRIDVDASRGTTRLTADAGAAGTLYGERAEAFPLAGPQRREFSGRNLAGGSTASVAVAVADAFDRWSDARDRLLAQSPSVKYASRDVPGIQQLDAYGDWQTDPSVGAIWFPRTTGADWAPYRYGRWESVAPWGWTWIDDAPWGFAPFHYGRWTQAGGRWGWVPGSLGPRPVYAPAVVGFLGQPGGEPFAVGGRPSIGWFPLAPGEAWRPPYVASPGYIARLNRAGFAQNNITGYYYQTRPQAVTVVPAGDFGRRGIVPGTALPVDPRDLAQARAVSPPAWQGPGFARYGALPDGARHAQFAPPPAISPLLPPSAPLSDRIQQQQWQRSQQMLEDRQRQEILRQQQQRSAQERFQPDASQRQLQLQREEMQLRQQYDAYERQRAIDAQRHQLQRQQFLQQQQMQLQQQQFQMQQRQQQEAQRHQIEAQQHQLAQMQQEQRLQLQRLQQQQRVEPVGSSAPRHDYRPPRMGMPAHGVPR